MAELADALDSKSSARKGVPVQVRPPVLPVFSRVFRAYFGPWRLTLGSAFYARFYASQREVGLNMAAKPSKPYASYPLYAHAGGVWAKKIRGKVHYFGPWSDPQGALESYLEKRDYLYGGLEPPTVAESVGELIDSFLEHKRAHLATGDITRVTFREYETTCKVIQAHFGKRRPVASLTPTDFVGLRTALSKRKTGTTPLGVATLKRRLTVARMIFADQRRECRRALKAPPQRLLRERARERGRLLYSAADVRKLVKAADPHLKAMILLGINCGFGPKDCCTLPANEIEGGWHNFARPKTGVERRCPLWPETVKAIEAVRGKRLVFNGRVWNRFVVAEKFAALCEACDVTSHGFYSLRRTFETIATTASVSQAAIDHIMGHARNDMASVYRQQIFDQQLKECANHVRAWFLGTLTLA